MTSNLELIPCARLTNVSCLSSGQCLYLRLWTITTEGNSRGWYFVAVVYRAMRHWAQMLTQLNQMRVASKCACTCLLPSTTNNRICTFVELELESLWFAVQCINLLFMHEINHTASSANLMGRNENLNFHYKLHKCWPKTCVPNPTDWIRGNCCMGVYLSSIHVKSCPIGLWWIHFKFE